LNRIQPSMILGAAPSAFRGCGSSQNTWRTLTLIPRTPLLARLVYNARPMKNLRRKLLALSLPAVAALAALIAFPVWARHSASPSGAAPNSAMAATPAKPDKGPFYLAYIGTYTTKQESKGIYAYNFNPATGEFTPIGLVAETTDPSFVA